MKSKNLKTKEFTISTSISSQENNARFQIEKTDKIKLRSDRGNQQYLRRLCGGGLRLRELREEEEEEGEDDMEREGERDREREREREEERESEGEEEPETEPEGERRPRPGFAIVVAARKERIESLDKP